MENKLFFFINLEIYKLKQANYYIFFLVFNLKETKHELKKKDPMISANKTETGKWNYASKCKQG